MQTPLETHVAGPEQGKAPAAAGHAGLLTRLKGFLAEGHPLVQLKVLLLLAVGWLLSPFCWWNDLVINLPLAYGFGWLLKLCNPTWFVPGLVAGYWLSNVAGIVLMQSSALEVFQPQADQRNPKRELLIGLATSTGYTTLVFLLVHFGVIHTPIPDLGVV
mgnify:FL=1